MVSIVNRLVTMHRGVSRRGERGLGVMSEEGDRDEDLDERVER